MPKCTADDLREYVEHRKSRLTMADLTTRGQEIVTAAERAVFADAKAARVVTDYLHAHSAVAELDKPNRALPHRAPPRDLGREETDSREEALTALWAAEEAYRALLTQR